MRHQHTFHNQVLAAVPCFLVYALLLLNPWFGVYAITWPQQLVGFGAMFMAPAVLEILRRQGINIYVPTVVFLAAWVCMILSVEWRSGFWAVPWFLVTLWIAGQAVTLYWNGTRTLVRLIMLSGPAMLAVGGAWYLADQCEWQPMGFDFLIVRLTAAHFHFAGLVLPVVAGLVLQHFPGRLVKGAAIGVMAGVPMVATGITLTRMGVRAEVECCLALTFSVFAFSIGVAQAVLGWRARDQIFKTRALLVFSGISLVAGMSLAMLYGLRPWVQLPWLQNLPRMWAWHGSIQAFGFALCALSGWAEWRPAESSAELSA